MQSPIIEEPEFELESLKEELERLKKENQLLKYKKLKLVKAHFGLLKICNNLLEIKNQYVNGYEKFIKQDRERNLNRNLIFSGISLYSPIINVFVSYYLWHHKKDSEEYRFRYIYPEIQEEDFFFHSEKEEDDFVVIDYKNNDYVKIDF